MANLQENKRHQRPKEGRQHCGLILFILLRGFLKNIMAVTLCWRIRKTQNLSSLFVFTFCLTPLFLGVVQETHFIIIMKTKNATATYNHELVIQYRL